MADHVRKQIRGAVAAALANLPTIGDRVFPGRAYDLGEDEMPGVIITTATRDAGERSGVDLDGGSIGGPVTLARMVPVSVIGFDKGEDVEDRLDDIAVEVEQAIAAAQDNQQSALMVLVKDVRLVATQIGISAQGDTRVGQIRLSYEIDYLTVRDAPAIAVQ